MKMEEYRKQAKELQERVNQSFEKIKGLSIPNLDDTEWYSTQCQKLTEHMQELIQLQEDFRRLQAQQYGLFLPEDQMGQIPGFDASKYQEADKHETQQEPQEAIIRDPAADIATAVAGVGALIHLFRKARR